MKFYCITTNINEIERQINIFLSNKPNAVIEYESITCVALNEFRVLYSFFYRN